MERGQLTSIKRRLSDEMKREELYLEFDPRLA